MEIEFKYVDILSDDALKNDDYIFTIPNGISGKRGDRLSSDRDVDTVSNPSKVFYGRFYATNGRENHFYRDYDGAAVYTNADNCIKLKNSPTVIVDALKTEKHLIGIKPDDGAAKAIKIILFYLGLDNRNSIFIGPMWLGTDYGFGGTSIFCDNKFIAAQDKFGYWIRATLEEGQNYKLIFKSLTGIAEKPSKLTFKHFVETSIVKAAEAGANEIDKIIKSHKEQVRAYKSAILEHAQRFKENKLTERETADFLGGVKSERVKRLLANSLTAIRGDISRVNEYSSAYKKYLELYNEARENEAYAKKCIKESGKDWAAVSNLLKKGFIERLEYSRKGLVWSYPPMSYKTLKPGCREEIFLGRVEVGLEPTYGFFINPTSYKLNENRYRGTWHFRQTKSGRSFCLGSFGGILYNLAHKRQIAQLIAVFKEYILSANWQSPHCTPDFEAQNITNPQVIDDSYDVWKAANPDHKMPTTTTPEPEPDEDEEDEEEDQ